MKLEKIIENLVNKLFPKRMSPKLAVVNKTYTNAGKGTYCCDVEIVKAGNLERTGKPHKEVPISPIWAGKDKRGLYCTLQKDMIVIINYLDWDEAYPYVSGVWSDQYDTVEHKENEFLLIAEGVEFRINVEQKKISMKVGDNSEITLDENNYSIGKNASEPIPKGNELKNQLEKDKQLMHVLKTAMQSWTPVNEDGGAALKSALVGFFALAEADYENINSDYAKVK